MDIATLCNVVRQTAFDIHVYHGTGHLERIYESALCNRLSKLRIPFVRQRAIGIYDEDGAPLGDYVADMLVDSSLIVEIKVARQLSADHEAQMLAYLKASKVAHGLLVNFGSFRFQVRKYAYTNRRGIVQDG
jgi:GxxExxY protein